MKHHIIVKWNEQVKDKEEILKQVTELFAESNTVPGVSRVELIPNVVDRPNRFDLMIAITMEMDALPSWDASAVHKNWKERYGSLIAAKTIFDSEG